MLRYQQHSVLRSKQDGARHPFVNPQQPRSGKRPRRVLDAIIREVEAGSQYRRGGFVPPVVRKTCHRDRKWNGKFIQRLALHTDQLQPPRFSSQYVEGEQLRDNRVHVADGLFCHFSTSNSTP